MTVKTEYEYGQTIGSGGCTYIAPSLVRSYSRRDWFRCTCGAEFEAILSNVKRGTTKSCGCYNSKLSKERITTHGLTGKHPLHRTWMKMLSRCNSPINRDYPSYGGRGIKVCDRWQGRDGFPNFLEDMGDKPSTLHSIDRIDNNKGYSKDNCRWATPTQQNRNTRRNLMIEYRGEIKTLAEWSESIGVSYKILRQRLARDKWSVEKAFTTPVR